MISRIARSIRNVFVWASALLAIGVAALAVRSFWRCDEAGYFTWKPDPAPNGRDCRNLIGSWRGGIFWLRTEAVPNPDLVDWYGGEPTEIILNSSTKPQLASAALEMAVGSEFQPVPRWSRGGFNFSAGSGQALGRWAWAQLPGSPWWHRGGVVPHWVLFLLLGWAPVLRLRHRWVRYQRHRKGLCLNCGYDVRASGERCSECGQELRKSQPSEPPPRRRPGRYGAIVAAGVVLTTAVAVLWLYSHGRKPRAEPFVRLDPATTLPAYPLLQRVEFEIAPDVGMRFVLIPAGRFVMGSPPGESEWSGEEQQHEVVISKAFYIGITEVTQEQYESLMGTNPSKFKGARNPVECVSWRDAVQFCRQFSKRSGRKIRLPTEAEWEYACRARTSTPFHTGTKLARDMANYGRYFPSNRGSISEYRTAVVGSFPPNAWGLHDMHGNVSEWCSDMFGDYPSGQVIDPTGPEKGHPMVIRGGSWARNPQFCRSAHREPHSPAYSFFDIGFRCVMDAP